MKESLVFTEAFRNNEIRANKEMTKVCVFMAIVMGLMFIGYLTKFFAMRTYTLVYFYFPSSIAILLSPIYWSRTKMIEKSNYKYFVMFLVLSVTSALNIIVPKHGILAWAVVIFLANHYYSPKFCTKMYIAVLVLMLLSLYGGMFLGEYDQNLLTEGYIVFDEVTQSNIIYLPELPDERFEMLHNLLLSGENRYLKVFFFYYLPRAVTITICYFSALGLNRRTYRLLEQEAIATKEHEKLEAELNIASEIQISSLPKAFPNNDIFNIYGSMKSAKEVGGDLFDYYRDEDDLYCLIGDVSGKSVPGAMFMMKAITLFKTLVVLKLSPAELLKRINSGLYKDNDSMMFMTAFIFKINLVTGEVIYSNAGHCPPLVKNGKDESYHYLKCNSGFILGTMEEAFVIDEKTKVSKGASIFLYTDGVTEAKGPNNTFYGEKKLLDFVNKEPYYMMKSLNEDIINDVVDFRKDIEQADDITMLSFLYKGSNELNIKAKVENIYEGIHFIEQALDLRQAGTTTRNNVAVVLDELLSNIANYGYKDKEPGMISLRYSYDDLKMIFKLEIIDDGIEFNPLEALDPDLELDAKDRQIGGLGIFMVKNLVDDIQYEYKDNKNVLVLFKKLGEGWKQ